MNRVDRCSVLPDILYAVGLRAELTSRLGVRWNEVVNGQVEIADAPDSCYQY